MRADFHDVVTVDDGATHAVANHVPSQEVRLSGVVQADWALGRSTFHDNYDVF